MSLLFILFVCQFVCQLVNTNNLSYSLYWSGYTSYSNFSGLNNGSFLPIWEASPFTIQVNRGLKINTSYISFDGSLRNVALTFNSSDDDYFNIQYLIFGGRMSLAIRNKKDGRRILQSHYPIYSQKPDSFWTKEFKQMNEACTNITDDSLLYPGCLNSPDEIDTSFVSILFPVGHASRPYGKYTDGIISVSLVAPPIGASTTASTIAPLP